MGLGWYAARLRAMSPVEVAHRLRQTLRREARRLRTERTTPHPLPSIRPSGAHPVRFFDLAWSFPSSEPIDWSRDYQNHRAAPRVFYGDLDYRDFRQVGDSKYTWELNRHQFLAPWALAYRSTGDEDHATAVVALILDWIRANPRYLGINWISGLEMALRIVSWGIALDLCAASPHVQEARGAIAASVADQAAFVRASLSRFSSANNHLVGELVGLLAAAAFFPEGAGAPALASFAAREITREALRQTFPDGVNREQAVYYHHYTLEYALTAMALCGRLGLEIPDELRARVHRMLAFVDAMTDDAGEAFEVGDRDDGTVTGLNLGTGVGVYESLLWSGWLVFGDAAFGAHAARIARRAGRLPAPDPRSRYWHHRGDAPALEETARRDARRLFADGGYFLSTDDGLSLLFKAGPFGYPSIAAHAHCDQLSLGLKRGEATLLTDGGTFVYHTDERWRRFFKGTSAHNTVAVDERDQAEFAGSFLWSTHADGRLELRAEAPDRFLVWGSHDGYRRLADPVGHERTVEYRRGRGYRVCDRLTGREPHRFALFWNFGAGLTLRPLGSGSASARAWLVLQGDEPAMAVRIEGDHPLRFDLYEGDEALPAGFESRRYLQKRSVVCLRTQAEGPTCRLVTLLVTSGSPLSAALVERMAEEWD